MRLDQENIDAGTFAVLMQRFTFHRLPRARRLLDRVNAGQRITDYDILWLKRVYSDSRQTQYMVERYPEYTKIYVSSISLFAEITAKALENEKAGPLRLCIPHP